MRKTYQKPEISVAELIVCSMLSTSFSISNHSKGDFKEDFARKHRGTWGNLWAEDDKKDI